MDIERKATTQETIKIRAQWALVVVKTKNGDVEEVYLEWPHKEGSSSGWYPHEIQDPRKVLPSLRDAITEAIKMIDPGE